MDNDEGSGLYKGQTQDLHANSVAWGQPGLSRAQHPRLYVKEVDPPGFTFQLCCILAVWPLQTFDFFIYRQGIVTVPTLQGCKN